MQGQQWHCLQLQLSVTLIGYYASNSSIELQNKVYKSLLSSPRKAKQNEV
ncbi:hypothetical protein XBI1_580024 [Xenorhabdus bovienii str. Intermedium]|uniref:Uncharacterized protein n=1 Tax=Xenorhabdus bovienii str. Intermedium TaxID=1379677 RepID=A0A077QMQ9_XENBV|nr:hypothetical protein XBI1_580024 [Xenorhabdus bovienii str. Intermedium]